MGVSHKMWKQITFLKWNTTKEPHGGIKEWCWGKNVKGSFWTTGVSERSLQMRFRRQKVWLGPINESMKKEKKMSHWADIFEILFGWSLKKKQIHFWWFFFLKKLQPMKSASRLSSWSTMLKMGLRSKASPWPAGTFSCASAPLAAEPPRGCSYSAQSDRWLWSGREDVLSWTHTLKTPGCVDFLYPTYVDTSYRY